MLYNTYLVDFDHVTDGELVFLGSPQGAANGGFLLTTRHDDGWSGNCASAGRGRLGRNTRTSIQCVFGSLMVLLRKKPNAFVFAVHDLS